MKFLPIDKLGLSVSVLTVLSLVALPFVHLQPNRIMPGEGFFLADVLMPSHLATFTVLMLLTVLSASTTMLYKLQLILCTASAFILLYSVGASADGLLDGATPFARVSLGSGFWTSLFLLGLLLTDVVIKLNLQGLKRLLFILSVVIGIVAVLKTGALDNLSIIKEYQNQDTFWQQALRHVQLSFGSLVPAILVGIPLGIKCHRSQAVRNGVVPILNVLQTIPSLAMFGILMIPLSYIAVTFPALSDLGIKGIGAAPAVIALFFYSLLPIVSNTIAGFDKLDAKTLDAARGMGMNARQVLFGIELPLALPVILSGIRIVVTMNIGLVAVAGLIGGGGFGTYIFQGLGQTATDLVILGAFPTLLLSFVSAVLIDAIIEVVKGNKS
ncbi:ABC transporter permease [Photobacterium sp. BZF1]|uniref:ABC transporter permease n=1 Tax=Photobacterium sp. BZF1 TaxID=1904457 RepID=UPI001CA46404|nr:ABC transporter permease [Photobacterium sp. BZF1]